MKVLVGCEYSGRVREAFRARGHEVWSFDLLPSEDASPHHFEWDVTDFLDGGWDLAIFHPPCTHLAVSGARWFASKAREQAEALQFVKALLEAPIARIALENPVSIISTRIRKADQAVQPWMFGHPENKTTCLWLKGLPPLRPTHDSRALMLSMAKNRTDKVHHMPPGPDRWKERSRTYTGLAAAMAAQWG